MDTILAAYRVALKGGLAGRLLWSGKCESRFGVARRVHGVPKKVVEGHREAISTYTRRGARRSMAGKLRGRLRTPAFCARTRAPRDFPRRNYVFGSVAIGATATLPKGEPP